MLVKSSQQLQASRQQMRHSNIPTGVFDNEQQRSTADIALIPLTAGSCCSYPEFTTSDNNHLLFVTLEKIKVSDRSSHSFHTILRMSGRKP
ncbi:hypothetical protein GF407_01810 [candidate division KSB1 bacterium]|nr:hypothetical protein [candidate division KSB1 bacterium]